jgi:NAD(P)-dependent dehydrogenase (short-subunit alcohol dehydrogenase family)
MTGKVLITGNSSGLGRGFTAAYLGQGWTVYGISRRGCEDLDGDLHDIRCDLGDPDAVAPALEQLLAGVDRLDLVILNAGVLGPIRDLADTPVATVEEVMRINVWANKRILDWFLSRPLPVTRIVLISSGAAVTGHRGWGAYALSKATLNMLTQLYAHEFAGSQLLALAPGLVDTAMQSVLCDPAQTDAGRFPSLQRLRDARGTGAMPDPTACAARIVDLLPSLADRPSGSFVDVRDL